MNHFLKELQRRNVVRVGVAYLAVAWLIIQLVGEIGPILELSEWFSKVLLGLLAAGFLITLVLAWIYDLTNKGIRRTEEVDRDTTLHSLRGRPLDFVIIGALLLALAYFVWESRFAEENREAGSVESVAVLPFKDLSAAGDQQYFADGISEELLNALSSIPELKVAGRSSSFSFRDAQPNVALIADKLKVSHVLEGSIRTSGEQMRVSAQLVSGKDGFQVWSRVFDGSLSDVFQVQDELARLVVEALKFEVLDGEQVTLPSARTTNMQTYNAYLLGRHELSGRTAEGIKSAVTHFREAIRKDPAYSPAYSGLAKTLVISPYYVKLSEPSELFNEARSLAEKSIELDKMNSEGFSVLGTLAMLYDRNWAKAKQQLYKSVEIHPNDASNLNLFGDYLYTVGDYLSAREYEGRAAELEPLSAANQHELALVSGFLGQPDEAIALEKLAVKLNPRFKNGWGALALLYFQTGRHEELDAILESPDSSFNAQFLLRMDVMRAIKSGDIQARDAAMEQVVAMAERGALPATYPAFLFASMANDQKAAEWVNRAYELRDPILVSPLYFFLPEDWPGLPITRDALDRPDLQALFQLRRDHIEAGSGRVVQKVWGQSKETE